jgi:two-component system, OmpR family, sensor histidine kinase VanS
VARNDLNRDNGELVDRLHAVNTRAIDLTEALLLLSRADQRSFTREHLDLSLIAEEATETLLPLAEKQGVTIETAADITPTIGSHALLLQMSDEACKATFGFLRAKDRPAAVTTRVPHVAADPSGAKLGV